MRQNRCRKKFWQATHADSPQGATLGLSALAWRFRGYHIKTHLWDLSTNLSKLNILLKLKNIVLCES